MTQENFCFSPTLVTSYEKCKILSLLLLCMFSPGFLPLGQLLFPQAWTKCLIACMMSREVSAHGISENMNAIMKSIACLSKLTLSPPFWLKHICIFSLNSVKYWSIISNIYFCIISKFLVEGKCVKSVCFVPPFDKNMSLIIVSNNSRTWKFRASCNTLACAI